MQKQLQAAKHLQELLSMVTVTVMIKNMITVTVTDMVTVTVTVTCPFSPLRMVYSGWWETKIARDRFHKSETGHVTAFTKVRQGT